MNSTTVLITILYSIVIKTVVLTNDLIYSTKEASLKVKRWQSQQYRQRQINQ